MLWVPRPLALRKQSRMALKQPLKASGGFTLKRGILHKCTAVPNAQLTPRVRGEGTGAGWEVGWRRAPLDLIFHSFPSLRYFTQGHRVELAPPAGSLMIWRPELATAVNLVFLHTHTHTHTQTELCLAVTFLGREIIPCP